MILRLNEDTDFDRIVVDGELDLPRAAELLEVIRDAADEGRDVYVEIGEVTGIGFPALQVLAAAARDFGKRKKRFMLSEPSPPCEKALELSGLRPLLYGRLKAGE